MKRTCSVCNAITDDGKISQKTYVNNDIRMERINGLSFLKEKKINKKEAKNDK